MGYYQVSFPVARRILLVNMAQRRMFSQRIVGDEKFLEMPVSAQNLYFHLGIYADDDGFVNPQKIVRMIGANPDDLKVLITKEFVIPFEGGVVVVTHWKENNYIQKDRYTPTIYQEQLKKLDSIQNVYKLDTQVRLGKVRLELGKDRDNTMSAYADAFNQFWDKYPRKELKKKSKEIWLRIKPPLQEILNFIEKAKLTDRWEKGFIKQPTAFLNGECWNDDLSAYNDTKKEIKNQDLIIK